MKYMPGAGTTKMSKAKKAKIIAERRRSDKTVEQIAAENGITPTSVYNASNCKDPEVLELAETFEQRIIALAKTNVEQGLEAMKRRIQKDKDSLASVTGAVKASHELLRLETNQPTAIHQVQRAPIEYAIEYATELLAEQPIEIAREIFRRSGRVKYGIRATDEDWSEAASIVFDGKECSRSVAQIGGGMGEFRVGRYVKEIRPPDGKALEIMNRGIR